MEMGGRRTGEGEEGNLENYVLDTRASPRRLPRRLVYMLHERSDLLWSGDEWSDTRAETDDGRDLIICYTSGAMMDIVVGRDVTTLGRKAGEGQSGERGNFIRVGILG